MATTEYEYAIFRVGDSETEFQVVKYDAFGNGELPPAAIYNVRYDSRTGKGKCDCPAATYRQTGANDKHVKLVAAWLSNGDSRRKK